MDAIARTCSTCRQVKPATDFSPQGRGYLDSRCRPCNARRRAAKRTPRNAVAPATYRAHLGRDMYAHLSDGEAAYVAGLIDGDGCITSSHPRNNDKPLQITVCMIHRPTIEWLGAHCGGSVGPGMSPDGTARQSWRWHIRAIRATALLARVASFMVTKRDEALVALELGETLWENQVQGRVTTDVLARRAGLGQELRDLKRREWPA